MAPYIVASTLQYVMPSFYNGHVPELQAEYNTISPIKA